MYRTSRTSTLSTLKHMIGVGSVLKRKQGGKMDTNVIGNTLENNIHKLKRDIFPLLSQDIADVLARVDLGRLEIIEEIRLRAEKPLCLQNYKSEWFVRNDGCLECAPSRAYIINQRSISRSLEIMSGNSIYAYQEEIKNGYITIKGGHRIGITGKVVCDGAVIRNIKDISGLNIRISNQVIGCANKILSHIINGKNSVNNTLLISPPRCGKTTLLRDIARSLGNGIAELGFKGIRVGIVDERSEIAACYRGLPQNEIGIRTDVLDGCLKSLGMPMLIRAMSPDVIITDEIGCDGDREAVHGVLNAGVKVITSAHGYNISDLKSRREVLRLVDDKVFERYIVLGNNKGPGTVVEVIDGTTMKPITGEGYHVA